MKAREGYNLNFSLHSDIPPFLLNMAFSNQIFIEGVMVKGDLEEGRGEWP